MTLTWIDDLGEYDLNDANGMELVNEGLGLNMPPSQNSYESRLNADGETLANTRYGPRMLDFEVHFYGNAMVNVARLASRLNRGPGVLRHKGWGSGQARELRQVSREDGLTGRWSGLAHFQQDLLTLKAADPWWYGPMRMQSLQFDDGVLYSDPTVLYSSPTTLYSGAPSTTVLVEGDEPAVTTLKIGGPFDTLRVRPSAGAASVELSGPLAAGEEITVVSAFGDRGPRLNGASPDWSLLTPESDPIELPVGSTKIVVEAQGADPGVSYVEVCYRERWLTP